MTPQSWGPLPHFKIVTGSTTIEDDEAITIQVSRPENNISFAVLTLNDYQSKNYVGVFDLFNNLEVHFKYGSGSYTQVFAGIITDARPRFNEQGEILDVSAWGRGWALVKTLCNTSFGKESANPTKDTPQEILQRIVTNHVNLDFDGATTWWNIGEVKILGVHGGLSITHINSSYLDNFTLFNRVCDIVNAYAQGLGPPEVSIHWYMNTAGLLYCKKIDADHTDGNWDRYWGGTAGTDPGTQASSTIVVKEDMVLYDFQKNIHEYANKILLACAFRKPAYDWWTENQSGLWGSDANCDLADENGAGLFVVGSYSLKATPNDVNTSAFWYPAAENAGWDLTRIGSQVTPCYIGFYYRQTRNPTFISNIAISTNYGAGDYFSISTLPSGSIFAQINEWNHISLPIGPYHAHFVDEAGKTWSKNGNADWSNVNAIRFNLFASSSGENCYIDDLHLAGKIIREAYDASEITITKKQHMKLFRMDTAVDDMLIASDDSGTAARLCYAELLRRAQTPIVGMIKIPLAETVLPGQTVHIHACQQASGTYRIDADFRIKELTHVFQLPHPFTILNLTDDVTNTHAFGAPTKHSLLMEYAGALGHAEAKDLKVSGIDNLIPRLSKSY